MRDARLKSDALRELLSREPGVVVGFSGGVDSAFLTVMAHDVLGAERVVAMLGVSASLARDVHTRALHLAREFGVDVREIETREFEDADYTANRGDRCFHCKHELWQRLAPFAAERGFRLCDGTIVDDLAEHRPGRAAGERAGVWSPLAECGFTKADVRALARARGIPIWNAPAAPCLSSRIAHGVPATRDRVALVDRAETALRELGIEGDLRVRHVGDAARIELPAQVIPAWSSRERRAALAHAVQGAGFARVLFDERGYRRGALQEPGVATVAVVDITERSDT